LSELDAIYPAGVSRARPKEDWAARANLALAEADEAFEDGEEAAEAPFVGPEPGDEKTYVVPDESERVAQEEVEEREQPIAFASLRDFLQLDYPKAESLVGHHRAGTNLLPRYGWVMPWGPAGSTKTSLLVDLIFHAASARPWLGYPIARPLRFILIVNEGIPGGLQDKLTEKLELWGDDEVLDRVALYASPRGSFSFRNARMFEHLQDFARDFAADYVAGDPLHTLGAIGAGTPQDTENFKHLLRAFGVWEWIGIVTPHHSNKTGMVSGDWPRHPDTVIRLEKVAKRPETKFTLEKARPADPAELDVPRILEWIVETRSYLAHEIEQREKVSDDEMLVRIVAGLGANPGVSMSELQELVKGDTKRVSQLVKAEIEAGRIVNTSPKRSSYRLELSERGGGSETAHTEELEWS
jgi:hypothetical protein